MRDLGERVKVQRLARGMTKSLAAKRIGIRRSTLFNIENGKNEPNLRSFRLIARWLGLYDEDVLRYIREPIAVRSEAARPIKEREKCT